MNVQLARGEPHGAELDRGMRAWKDDYPWLHRAFKEIGPGARAASDDWRVRIENELKTTLDFKVRPDGTAAVWCGMSAYEFRQDPTPKELLRGLAEAYQRELKHVGGSYATRTATWRMSASPRPRQQQTLDTSGQAAVATRSGPVEAVDEWNLYLRLWAVLLPRAAQFTLIFIAVTAFTLALSAVADAIR